MIDSTSTVIEGLRFSEAIERPAMQWVQVKKNMKGLALFAVGADALLLEKVFKVMLKEREKKNAEEKRDPGTDSRGGGSA